MKFSEIRKILSTKTVGIAGAGGLGSNCAVALARTGVGKLIIADFDRIDSGNLNRQYFFYDQIGQFKVDALKTNIKRIHPDIEINAYRQKLDPELIIKLFEPCDLIVEAFDQADQKSMLIETVLETWPEKHIIVGSGMSGIGNLDQIRIARHNQIIICGDQESEISETSPPLAPKVGIVANMQADTAIEILLSS